MSHRDDFKKSDRLIFLNRKNSSKLGIIIPVAIAIGVAWLIARTSVLYFFQV